MIFWCMHRGLGMMKTTQIVRKLDAVGLQIQRSHLILLMQVMRLQVMGLQVMGLQVMGLQVMGLYW